MKGFEFEKIIEKYLEDFCKKEKGFFMKSPIPNQIKKTENKYIIVYTNKALCDFIGIYNKKFVLIEVKSISSNYWEPRRLKKHQYDQLKNINQLGGISIIIFYVKKINKIIFYKISQYDKLIEENLLKNVNIKNLIKYGKVIEPDKNIFLDVFKSIFLN